MKSGTLYLIMLEIFHFSIMTASAGQVDLTTGEVQAPVVTCLGSPVLSKRISADGGVTYIFNALSLYGSGYENYGPSELEGDCVLSATKQQPFSCSMRDHSVTVVMHDQSGWAVDAGPISTPQGDSSFGSWYMYSDCSFQ